MTQYVIRERHEGVASTGPYLRLVLGRGHETLKAVYWSVPPEVVEVAKVGTVVNVMGQLRDYKGERQLILKTLVKVPENKIDLHALLPQSPHDRFTQDTSLDRLLASIENPDLRRLADAAFGDPEFNRRYRLWPAAVKMHHAWLGGLVDHCLEVAAICERYAEVWRPMVNRDVVIMGALIHDVGKLEEISVGPMFDLTKPGRLFGHVVLGLQWLAEMQKKVALPEPLYEELCHMIASHHGKMEWGAVTEPKTPNAMALHLADLASARLTGVYQMISIQRPDGEWTPYDPIMGTQMYLGFMEQPEQQLAKAVPF